MGEKSSKQSTLGVVISIISVCIFIALLAVSVYQTVKIGQLEKQVSKIVEANADDNSEWSGRKQSLENVNFVYFDPDGSTYHSSTNCPLAKNADELASMKIYEFTKDSIVKWGYVQLKEDKESAFGSDSQRTDTYLLSGDDKYFPCAICIEIDTRTPLQKAADAETEGS